MSRFVSKAGHMPARRFPSYATLMFVLAFVFVIPASAYMGEIALLVCQPLLIIGLYCAMRKAPKLLMQQVLALVLIAVCIWSAPYLRHGGQLLTDVVIAETSTLFGKIFGYVAIMIAAPVMWIISPWLNPLPSYRDNNFQISSLYVLFAGILFMAFTTQAAKLQQANDDLAHSNQEIESLTLSRERGRMASEMHDSIGQQLSAIHYAHESAMGALEHLRGKPSGNDRNEDGAICADGTDQTKEHPRHNGAAALMKTSTAPNQYAGASQSPHVATAIQSVERAERITKGALTEVRQMARALSPSAFGGRLSNEAINRMAQSFASTGLNVDAKIVGNADLLSTHEQTLLFRTLQETLTNAVRHAHAMNMRILVCIEFNDTKLTVEDDGPGMSEHDIGNGFGLAALRTRVENIGGMLNVGESHSLGGASILVTIPRQNNDKVNNPAQ